MKHIPEILAAYDKKRNRFFVLAKPNLSAVKVDNVWYQSQPISQYEIDNYYDLITDLQLVKSLVEEAKTELNIP